jgi:hypothetical protein
MEVESVYPDKRAAFPEAEAKLIWLNLLLDAYSVVDEGVELALGQQSRGRILACRKGCAGCCRIHAAVPVYPLEMAGMAWYCTEAVSGGQRFILAAQLESFEEGKPCPFLVDEICVIYPLRPMACRQFNVFGLPCAENEDPFYSRPEDVLTPLEEYVDAAFRVTLPFYGITNEGDKDIFISTKQIHRQVRVLQHCNWKELAKKMRAFDARLEQQRHLNLSSSSC